MQDATLTLVVIAPNRTLIQEWSGSHIAIFKLAFVSISLEHPLSPQRAAQRYLLDVSKHPVCRHT